MRMKLEDGTLYIAGMDSTQFAVIKSWNLMRWDRVNKWLAGDATLELLNKLRSITRFPESIEAERQRQAGLQAAVDSERMKENPTKYKFPVKVKLFKHQERAGIMAMLTLGLLSVDEWKELQTEPPGGKEPCQ